jgi:predicted nucleic acid-binding protein
MPVIDSSTLVSFAKINKLELIKLISKKVVAVREVYEECVEKGVELGYADANKIKQLFNENIVGLEAFADYKKFSGVSEVDSKVITLAKARKDSLFADDAKLSRRAKAEDVEVRNTPDILLHLMRTKRITKQEFRNLLRKLVTNKRMSGRTKRLYEKEGGLENGESDTS